MEEILRQISEIAGTTYRIYSYQSAYADKPTHWAKIEREVDGMDIKCEYHSEESPLAALQEVWDKFQNLIYAGVPKSQLYPKRLEHISNVTNSVANPGNLDETF